MCVRVFLYGWYNLRNYDLGANLFGYRQKVFGYEDGLCCRGPWVGAMLGNVIGGWLSDKVFEKRRKPVMLLTTISTVFMMYCLIYSPNAPVILNVAT